MESKDTERKESMNYAYSCRYGKHDTVPQDKLFSVSLAAVPITTSQQCSSGCAYTLSHILQIQPSNLLTHSVYRTSHSPPARQWLTSLSSARYFLPASSCTARGPPRFQSVCSFAFTHLPPFNTNSFDSTGGY
eukprot:761774-Hanusia_phi.AAC.4